MTNTTLEPIAAGTPLAHIPAALIERARNAMHEWLLRRYVEADYQFLEARYLWWWEDRRFRKAMRKREFWRRLSGGNA